MKCVLLLLSTAACWHATSADYLGCYCDETKEWYEAEMSSTTDMTLAACTKFCVEKVGCLLTQVILLIHEVIKICLTKVCF